jgi:ferritin-like protein
MSLKIIMIPTARTIAERPRIRERGFPNATTAAYYDYFTLSIVLPSFDSQGWRRALASKTERRLPTSLCAHELSHWLDHTTTIWGMKLLEKQARAIQAWDSQDTTRFHEMLDLALEIQRIHSASYYRTKGPRYAEGTTSVPWRVEESSGLRFDRDGRLVNDPILFLRFLTNERSANEHGDGADLVVRLPFVSAALTEAIATATEFLANMKVLMEPIDENFVEKKFWLDDLASTLYDPELALYTAAHHVTANHCAIDNLAEVYPLTSALAHVTLDLPSDIFKKINLHRRYHRDPIAERGGVMLSRHAYEFAFLNFVKFTEGERDVIGAVEKSTGIDISTIRLESDREYERIAERILEMDAIPKIMKAHVNAGIINRAEFAWNDRADKLSDRFLLGDKNLSLPLAVLDDGGLVPLGRRCFEDGLMKEEGISTMGRYYSAILTFVEACNGRA